MTTLVGLLLVALGLADRMRTGADVLSGAGMTLGEGLVAAAVVGFLVDRRLKLDLAREISKKTSETFFREFLGGRSLPDIYYDRMRELAAANVLSLGVAWHVHLAWADETDPNGCRYLRVTSTVHNTFINTSRQSQGHAVTWLMYLRDGRPASRLTRWELTVISDDQREGNRVGQMHRAVLSERQLEAVNERIARNDAGAANDALLPEIPAGATAVLCASGMIFHGSVGLMPLVCRYPTLGQEVTVDGPALPDLQLSVRSGAREIEPAPGTAPTARHFRVDTLVLAGWTLCVEWVPRNVTIAPSDLGSIPTQAIPQG